MPPKTNEPKKAQPPKPEKPQISKRLEKYQSSTTYKKQLYGRFPKVSRENPLQIKDAESVGSILDLAFRYSERKDIHIDPKKVTEALTALLSEVKNAENAATQGNFSTSTNTFWQTMYNCLLAIGMSDNFIQKHLNNIMHFEKYSMEDMRYFREVISSMILWRVEDPYGSWEHWLGVKDVKAEEKKDTEKSTSWWDKMFGKKEEEEYDSTVPQKFTELASSFANHRKDLTVTAEKDAASYARILADSWEYSTQKKSQDELNALRIQFKDSLTTLFEYEQGLKACNAFDLARLANNIQYLFPDSTASWMPLYSPQPTHKDTPKKLADYIRNYALVSLNPFMTQKDVSSDSKDATLNDACGAVASDPDVPFRSEDELKEYQRSIEQCYQMVSENTQAFVGSVDMDAHMKNIRKLREYATEHKTLLDSVEKKLKNGNDRISTLRSIPIEMRSIDYDSDRFLANTLYPAGSLRVPLAAERQPQTRQMIANRLKNYATLPKRRLAEILTATSKDAVRENYNYNSKDRSLVGDAVYIVGYSKQLKLLSFKGADGEYVFPSSEMEKSLNNLITWLQMDTSKLGKIEGTSRNEKFTLALDLTDSKNIDLFVKAKDALKLLQSAARQAGLKSLFSQSLSQRSDIAKDLIYFRRFTYAQCKVMPEFPAIMEEMKNQHEKDAKTDAKWKNTSLPSYELDAICQERKKLIEKAQTIYDQAVTLKDNGVKIEGLDEQIRITESLLANMKYTYDKMYKNYSAKCEEEIRLAEERSAKLSQFQKDFNEFNKDFKKADAHHDQNRDWTKVPNLYDLTNAINARKELLKKAEKLRDRGIELTKDVINITDKLNIKISEEACIDILQKQLEPDVASLKESIEKIEVVSAQRTVAAKAQMEAERKEAKAKKEQQEKEKAKNGTGDNINAEEETDVINTNSNFIEKTASKQKENKIRENDVKTLETIEANERKAAKHILTAIDRKWIKECWLSDDTKINECGKTLNFIAAFCKEVQKDRSSDHQEYRDLMESMDIFKEELEHYTELTGDPILITEEPDYTDRADNIVKAFSSWTFKASLTNLYEKCTKYLNIHMESEPSLIMGGRDKKTVTGQLSQTGRIRKQAAVAIMLYVDHLPITRRLIKNQTERLRKDNNGQEPYPVTAADLNDLLTSLSKGSRGPKNYNGKAYPFYELCAPIEKARNRELKEEKAREAAQKKREARERAQLEKPKKQKQKAKS